MKNTALTSKHNINKLIFSVNMLSRSAVYCSFWKRRHLRRGQRNYVWNSPILPNKIIRIGRVSDATEHDIENYVNNIKTLVNLRNLTELKEDKSLSRFEVYSNYVDLVLYNERRSGGGLVRELAQEPWSYC